MYYLCKKYVPGKPIEEVERELGLTDIVKMASNENPFGCSPLAAAAMIKEIQKRSNLYPESLCVELRQKLAKKHNVDIDQIVVGNGLDNVITMLGMVFIDPKDEVIFGELTFPAYANITNKMNGVCVQVPMTNDERLDLDGFTEAITDMTKLIFVCNPNNPTGTINTKAEVDDFLKKSSFQCHRHF